MGGFNMRKTIKITALLMAFALLFPMTANMPPSRAVDATDLAAQIDAILGLNAVAESDGVTVTVTGDAVRTSTLALEIDAGVTVNWKADLSGTYNTTYLMNVSGGGTLEITDCTISNTAGTGGGINVNGANTTVTIGADGTVSSGRSGIAILASADNAAINVLSGGVVESLSGNTNPAIHVGSAAGVRISVSGGSVISETNGNAINDSGVTNNTEIIINGTVSSGSSGAISSAGANSKVDIIGGMVSNSSSSVINSTISMSGTGSLVTVSDGTVQNLGTSNVSYAIQTAGNVEVSGGGVFTIAGRAINLIGRYSTATVSGGIVQATTTGTAICTATTEPATVADSQVIVTGGAVISNSGYAIRVTGTNSIVEVSDGSVTSTSGIAIAITDNGTDASIEISGGTVSSSSNNAINAVTSARNSSIVVKGGSVSSEQATAIVNNGNNSSVIITDKGANPDPGGQVSSLFNGFAIRSNNSVEISGGFVFAFGSSTSSAIQATSITGPTTGDRGQVGVWDNLNGISIYGYNDENDLSAAANGIPTSYTKWYLRPAVGSGIQYCNGDTLGFFPLSFVTVVREYGLIFDAISGDILRDNDGSGGPSAANTSIQPNGFTITCFIDPGAPSVLELNGFTWSTDADVALTVYGADAEIRLTGDNLFESNAIAGMGIRSTHNITISGSGTLTAKGSDGVGGIGVSITSGGNLNLNGGTFIAEGYRAIDIGVAAHPDASLNYRWEYSGVDPVLGPKSGSGIYPPDQFDYYDTDHYVMFKSLDSVTLLSAEQIGGVSETYDSQGIVLTFSSTVTSLTADDIIIDGTGLSGAAVKGVLVGAGDTWTILLDSIISEGDVNVEVNHFGDFFVGSNIKRASIFKAPEYYYPELPTPPFVDPGLSPATVVIEAKINVSGPGAVLSEEGFDFAVIDEDGNIVATGKSDANGNVSFTPIDITEAGTYKYKVVVTTESGDGWIVDGREFIVIVVVTEQGDDLTAEIQYPDNRIPVFHNRHFIQETGRGQKTEPIMPFIQDHIAYINGYPDSTVRPEQNISRAEVAVVFYRLLTDELRDGDFEDGVSFPDVDPDYWYNTAIRTMSSLGVLNGYPDGTFKPDEAITRAELATIAAHFATMMHMAPMNHILFSDIDGHWAQAEIMYASEVGWVNGYEDGTFMPDRNISRAEFITLVNRVLGRVLETPDDLISDGMIVWIDNMDIEEWYYLAIQESTNSHEAEFKDVLVPGLQFYYEFWTVLVTD